MLSFEEARKKILEHALPLGTEQVSLVEAGGRILAEDILSPWDLPRWDNSAMDGFAVRAQDCNAPRTLRISDSLAAGDAAERAIEPGTAVKILTGAPIPPGADAVIPIEETEAAGSGEVRILQPVKRGAHVRLRGEDIRCGEVILRAGTRVSPSDVSVLASMSKVSVPVTRRPLVAVLGTGDELLEPGEPLAPGKIYNSNSWAVAAALREIDAIPLVLPVARDNAESLRKSLEAGLKADVLITSAGVSAGDRDLVREVLQEVGAREIFWKIDMKPGRPTALAVKGGTLIFSLPGNPVSTTLTFDQLVRPALLKMMGHGECLRPTVKARFEGDFTMKLGRTFLMRVRLRRERGELIASSAGNQDTGILKTMLQAEGIAILPPECSRLVTGQEVQVQVLREGAR